MAPGGAVLRQAQTTLIGESAAFRALEGARVTSEVLVVAPLT